jgi:uncharacterized protein YtpQ (UPF0354 family)
MIQNQDFGDKMNKKDYEAIAEVIRLSKHEEDIRSTVLFIIDNLSSVLKKDNLAFNKDRFIKACGVNE